MPEYHEPHQVGGVTVDHRHVEESEIMDTMAEPEMPEPDGTATGWLPTRKWMAATVVALTGFLTLLAQHGWHLDEHTSIMLITIISARLVSYLVPNPDTPGGVPDAG